jgi:hypothetical protein
VTTQAGVAIPVRVQVWDVHGNVVRNFSGPVTLSLDNGGTFLSSGTSAVVATAAEGEASFNVAIQQVHASYHVTASGDSLTSVVSAAFAISFVSFLFCVFSRLGRTCMNQLELY